MKTKVLAILFIASTHWYSINLNAQNNLEIVENSVSQDAEKYVTLFKDIHQNPELGFMEVRTSGIVANELRTYGFIVTEKIAKTGVAGVLVNGEGPIVMYRADMDCNSVKEITDLPYKSTKVVKLKDGSEAPLAHACGHDAHTTWMLSTAKFMAEHKDLWKGTVVFIAQPAEELILGAHAMVEDGLYTKYEIPKPDYLFGMHSMPIAVGMVAAASGLRMAGTDQLDITFHGVGGHGAVPHLAKDPVVMAASAIMQYQTLLSRGIDAKNSAVITVGSVQAGNDYNVIPSTAHLKVNLRWFNEKDRNTLLEGITRINEGIAHSYDLPKGDYPTIEFQGWSFPLENDPELTGVVKESLRPLVSDPRFLIDETVMPSIMGSEDVHHLVLKNKKSVYTYINVGIAKPMRFFKSFRNGALPFMAHNGNFEIDIKAIPYGSKVAITSMLAIFNQVVGSP